MKRNKVLRYWVLGIVYSCLGFSKIFGLVLVVISLNGCYEPKEGCLDASATNFDANADEPCLDCCTFPTLKLNVLHKVVLPDTTLNLVYNDSAYTVDGVNYFRINEILFYISNLKLRQTDGTLVGVEDSLQLKVPQNPGDTTSIYVENNFILIDRRNFQAYSIGNFKKSGNFEGIQFTLGIEGPANHADPSQLPDSSPLSIQEDSLYWNTDLGYIFNRIAFFRDTIAADTIPVIVEIGTENALRTVDLEGTFSTREGFNVTVVLQVDYLQWFKNVEVKTDGPQQVATKVLDNIANSFSLVEVKLE